MSRTGWTSTSSWITPPTRRRRSRPGWHGGRTGTVHFTPTSASWINQVERWFAELTRKQLQRGVHTSTRQLEADIRAFIDKHNEAPNPSSGPNRPTTSSLPSSAFAPCRSKLMPLQVTRESLNNPMFAVSRGRGGLDVKLDDIADRPGAALVTGYGANGRYPRRSASFPAVPPAAGRLLPCHPVA